MEKIDFKYGNVKYFIYNKYVYENQDYLLIIDKNIFDEETVKYANRLIDKFMKEKDEIVDYMLKMLLKDFYSATHNYSEEYIKNNLGKPQIEILFRKDGKYSNWKFEYFGVIEFCETKLDGHIISVEFTDELKLSEDIQIDG